jgi:predicted lipoprotein with Yx(FWY)xxD motif
MLVLGTVAMVAAACGGSSSKSASSTSTSKASSPSSTGNLQSALSSVGAAAPSSFTVSLAKGPQGIFETGPNGHTLYYFTKDTGTTSACTGACASTWMALTASGPVTAGPGVDKSQLATASGQAPNQVTYYGHFLYFFSGDAAPGDTKGVGIPSWFLLGPRGNQMMPH